MADPVYSVTFKRDYNSYAAAETAAFVKATAAKLFAIGVGGLSSDDQTTLASDIIAAKAAHPLQPVAAQTVVNPDGTISVRVSPGLPNYGN
jgi:hypothetical protein